MGFLGRLAFVLGTAVAGGSLLLTPRIYQLFTGPAVTLPVARTPNSKRPKKWEGARVAPDARFFRKSREPFHNARIHTNGTQKGAQTMTMKHKILACGIPGIAGFILLATTPFASAQFYLQENLVSDLASPSGGAPKIVDSNLVNPWGVAYGPTSPFWVANQGTATATLYSVNGTTGAVSKLGLVVQIPASLTGAPKGPTGQVFNGGPNFVVSQGGGSGPALFIFSALNGTISGWNPGVPPPPPSKQAVLAATGAPPPTVYTVLAIGTSSNVDHLDAD